GQAWCDKSFVVKFVGGFSSVQNSMKYQLSSAVKQAGHSVQSKNPFDTPAGPWSFVVKLEITDNQER
ncbi:MAG TPA: hypothetical protein PKX94_02430, partial [Opitutales bacterium]|nr:hypothetical protein [Opitutales bacterium]